LSFENGKKFGQVSAEFVWVYWGIVKFFNFKEKRKIVIAKDL